MPESSSLTLIVTEESLRVKSQAVRCEAGPSVPTSFYIARTRNAVSSVFAQ